MWQFVQLMFPGAYSGRLSTVCITSASPRRIDAPRESLGIVESAGGCHDAGSNAACAAVPAADSRRCASLLECTARHAATTETHASAAMVAGSLGCMKSSRADAPFSVRVWTVGV